MKRQNLHKTAAILAGFSLVCNSLYAQTNSGIGTRTPGSTLTINGSFAATYNNITATTYTMLASDYYLAWNGSAAGTVTLPVAISGSGNFKGRVYHIKNTSTNSSLTVAANGSELLDSQTGAGIASTTLPAGYYAMFISKGATSGTTWEVAVVGSSNVSTVTGADNGLTVGYNSAGKIGLGGTLAKATDVATAGNNLTISGTGYVGIGTTSPLAPLHVIGSGDNVINERNASDQNGAFYYSRKSRGTNAAPTAMQLGDNIGGIITQGYTGSGYSTSSNTAIYSKATQNWTSTATGSSLLFQVTPNNTATNIIPMVINNNGYVGINLPQGQSPYAPRAGLDVYGSIMIGALGVGNIPTAGNTTLISWNTLNVGGGETEFTNYRGAGGGAFRFYSISGTGATPASGNAIAFINSTGTYSVTSDARAKSNIHTLSGSLKKIMAIRPVSYDMHTNKSLKNGVVSFSKDDKTTPSLGFLAQELYKIVPEAVNKPKDETNEFYTVSYSTIIPVLTKAIQEQ